MKIADLIYDKIVALPESTQREVLALVDYLSQKLRHKDTVWSEMSLKAALRGLEGEVWPDYGEQDLKEKWE